MRGFGCMGSVVRVPLAVDGVGPRARAIARLGIHGGAHLPCWHPSSFDSLFLAFFEGQRLCINFYISRVKFVITLHPHLDVTCSCYF